jgi:hypothetical protein
VSSHLIALSVVIEDLLVIQDLFVGHFALVLDGSKCVLLAPYLGPSCWSFCIDS